MEIDYARGKVNTHGGPQSKLRRVAITGTIGSGKSTVLKIIQDSGRTVISADIVAASVMKDPSIRDQVANEFALNPDWTNSDLSELVFSKPEMRVRLNALIHPVIREQMLQSSAPYCEVPLLFESAAESHYDEVWAVVCDETEILRRLIARYGSQAEAERRIASQLPQPVKATLADRIIRTDRPFQHVESNTLQLVRDFESN